LAINVQIDTKIVNTLLSALTFAAFARAHPVVLARGRVTADRAQLGRRRRSSGHGGGGVPLRHNTSGVRRGRRTFDGHGHRQRVDAMPYFRRHAAAIGKNN